MYNKQEVPQLQIDKGCHKTDPTLEVLEAHLSCKEAPVKNHQDTCKLVTLIPKDEELKKMKESEKGKAEKSTEN